MSQLLKSRRRGIGWPAVVIGACILLAACGGDDCVINNTVTTTMNFYNASGSAVMINDELTVSLVRPGSDSIVLNRKSSATGVTVPLGFQNECDTFVFSFSLINITDSVFVHHTNQPYFISLDCGTAMFHTITSADCTHRTLQSVNVVHPEVNYDALENLQLVFND